MSKEKLEATLKALQQEYASKLPGTLAEIESNWQQLQQKWDITCFRQFHRQIHRIAGNAKTFGFSALTEVAQALDEYLMNLRARSLSATSDESDYISNQVAHLLHAMTTPDTEASLNLLPAEHELQAHNSRPLIYIVDDDQDFCTWIAQQLQYRGYQIKTFTELKQFRQFVRKKPPAVVIIDIMFEEGHLAGPQVMASIQRERKKPLPVIFMSARFDMTARLAAVRANGDGYFTKPLDITRLSEQLAQLTLDQHTLNQLVLIVDDSQNYGERYSRLLQQTGMKVKLLEQPMQILEILKSFKPTLILINTTLKELSGLELALVIRQQLPYTHLPIIFFAQQFDQTLRRAAMRGIADDFLSDTISPEQFIAVVVNRLHHVTQQHAQQALLQQRDAMTGLYNRQYVLAQLALVAENKSTKPLIIVYLIPDNSRSIEQIIGLGAVDEVLKNCAKLLQALTDSIEMTVGRLGDHSFVILTQQRSLLKIQQFVATLLQRRAEEEIVYEEQPLATSFSAGIALYQYGNNTSHQDSLNSPQQTLIAAEQACEQAKAQGGNQVLLHPSAQLERNDKGTKRQFWEQSITLALENDDLYLVYQPIASVHGETREYYDVLLRMRGREGNTILKAADFMPIAEQSSIMSWIDKWVVHKAIHTLAEKHQQGESFQFFIRLAANSLKSHEFLEWVQECFSETGLLPQAVIFDFNCDAVHAQQSLVQAFAKQVRILGCQLCFRDVEPSQAHLSLVETFKVEFIKPHSRLMQGLTESNRQQEGLGKLVQYVHRHECQVIAPFVENAATLTLLWQREVDYIGGHFLQQPTIDLNFDFSD